jgi:glycerol-3-phosphate cytidylyltransferase
MRIITYGTYDLFHYGHLQLLFRAKQLGTHLTVAVSTDEFNALKGKQAVIPYAQRSAIVAALGCVDVVIPEQTWDQKRQDIINHNIDAFVMGDDWKGKFDDLSDICKVIYLPRTEGISTTMLKQLLNKIPQEKIE